MASEAPAVAPTVELPVLMAATVVKGFGRGSKMLGIPTANMSIDELGSILDDIPTGIWYGWAFLRGEVYKAVASIGWNPYFDNDKKTVEPHLLHEFPEDFYGEKLRFLLCGFVRPEKNFPSLDALVAAIRNDIDVADKTLEEPRWKVFMEAKREWTTSCPTNATSAASDDGQAGEDCGSSSPGGGGSQSS